MLNGIFQSLTMVKLISYSRVVGWYFHFIYKFKTTFSKQTANTLCKLSMSYKKDIMFIWVNAKSLSIGF